MSKRHLLILGFILLLALALRIINLGGRSLWYDEAFAVLFAEKGLDAMLYGTLTPVAGGASDIHPLLYYGTLNVWMQVFGQAAFTVRFWSVLLGVVTVGLMYVIGRELFDEKTGLAAALITAIMPFHVQYSQETRMYALLGLLLMATTLCFIRGWRSKSWGWWVAFGVLAGLAMYTQQLAAFYLVALGLVPLMARRFDQFKRVAFGAAVAVIVYLPWLVNLPSQFEKLRSYYWLSPPNIARPILTTRSFLTVALDFPAPASMIAFIGALLIVLFLIIQVVLYLRRRVQPDRKVLLFVLWLTAAPIGLMWLVSQRQPVYLERSLIPAALMLYLALAWLIMRGGLPRPIAWALGAVGILLAGIGLYYQYTWATFPNSPFPAAIEYVREHWQPGDVVVHQNKLSALPMVYYGRDLTQRFIGDLPGSSEDTLALPTQESLQLLADACIQGASRDGQRVWWVIFDFAEKQYTSQGRPELQQSLDWLESHFTLVETQTFNDLDVVLYADARGDFSSECGRS